MIKYLIREKSGFTYSIVIILQESELIHIILYLQKTLNFHNFLIFIKPVVNKNKTNYYYNIISVKGSYKDKSNTHFCKRMLYIVNAIL